MTSTRVVNLRREPYDVYIGRGHGLNGTFGNPYDVRRYGKEAMALFREYFYARVAVDDEFRARVLALRGKRLGCFCKRADGTGDCHGDVIAAWLEENET